MRVLLFLTFIVHSLFAATLLNQNIYERDNRVDLMLSFDAPFSGSVKKSQADDGTLLIRLSGVQILKPFGKELRNSLVEAVSVTGSGNDFALIKIVPAQKSLNVEASKTIDGFGLRLRITPAKASLDKSTPLKSEVNALKPAPEAKPITLKESDSLPGWRYWSVLAIMLLLLLLLWFVKRRKFSEIKGGWLMPNLTGKGAQFEGATIRYQKPLDRENRLLLLEFNSKQYLMVVGNSNILLDTFTEGRIDDQESFTSLFEENKRQLDHFLKENHPDAYEAFKANAAKD